VREGIIKHSHDYTAAEYPELCEYLLDLRPPLEAQLIDLTDEIAYTTADLDDGFEAKLLKLEDVRKNVRAFESYFIEMEAKYPPRRQAEVQRGAQADAQLLRDRPD